MLFRYNNLTRRNHHEETIYGLSYFKLAGLQGCGGGMVNWSFLQAGIVDELNLFLAPVTDGSAGMASLFTRIPSLTEGKPVEFRLNRIGQIGDGGRYLNYRSSMMCSAAWGFRQEGSC